MKRVFCIDYENVTFVGAKGIEALKSSDKVLIFVNNGAKGISANAAKVYIATKAKIRFVDVEIGKPNALDFQLITYIAAKCNPSTEYYIISKDCGYDFAISMLVRCGKKNVHRFPTIAMALAGENVIGDTKTYSSEKTASAETKVNGVEKQQIPNDNNPFKEVFELIQSCGVAFDKDVYKNIIDAVEKTNGKFRCFTMLRSKYPSENNSCEVYQK